MQNWIPLALMSGLLLSGPAHAQRSTAVATVHTNSPSWLEKEIDVEIKNASIADAVKKVLESARVELDKIVPEFEMAKDMKISLFVKNARARDVLAAVARLGGAVAFVSEENGKTTIFLRPRSAAPIVITTSGTGRNASDNPQVQGRIRQAINEAASSYRAAMTFSMRERLPDKRVKLDVREGDIRDALKEVLKQAEIDYALEDDVPADFKRSFTFENVPIATALDVITHSADIGWRAERSGGKFVVRVGKKYARRLTSSVFPELIPPMEESVTALDFVPTLVEQAGSAAGTNIASDRECTDDEVAVGFFDGDLVEVDPGS